MRCRRFDTYAGWQWRNSDYEIATQGDWSGCLVDHLKKVGKSIRSAKDSYVRPLCSGWRKMLDACTGNRASAQVNLEAATGIQVVEDSRRRTRFRGRAASADVILRR
ncbi:hypothetical protein MT1_2835 [Pseudomonas sp. MT-1]|nr:hypothetical protein MT1_2835 [Pseudomonas sp. MT-1]